MEYREVKEEYFYPRPPRGGRLELLPELWLFDGISIHALREEGDVNALIKHLCKNLFLSTPSARRAPFLCVGFKMGKTIFLSTPSARRATGDVRRYFNPTLFLSTP